MNKEYCPLNCPHKLNDAEFWILAYADANVLIQALLKCKENIDCPLSKTEAK